MTFLALVGAAAFRAVPGVLIDPLHDEFGWSRVDDLRRRRGQPGALRAHRPVRRRADGAVRHPPGGRRRAAAWSPLGSGLTVFMTASWQLILCWGVLVGLGTGSMALSLVATVTGRWFVARRGLVSGVLTAGGAAGQLIFLPLVAWVERALGLAPRGPGHGGCRARRRPVGGLAAARPPARRRASRPTAGRRRTTSTRCAAAPARTALRGLADGACRPGRSGCWPAAS